MLRFVYLAQGKLFYQEGDCPIQEIVSQYGQEVIDRIARMHQAHGWKGQKREEGFLHGELLWGRRLSDPTTSNVVITAVSKGKDNDQLIYALDTDRVGGLFLYHLGQRQETRLFHEADFYIQDLCRCPDDEMLAYSLQFANGTANIGVMEIAKRQLRQLTEGDTLDQAPSWVPGAASIGVSIRRSRGGIPREILSDIRHFRSKKWIYRNVSLPLCRKARNTTF